MPQFGQTIVDCLSSFVADEALLHYRRLVQHETYSDYSSKDFLFRGIRLLPPPFAESHCDYSCHVRFGSKADMCAAKCHVRFTPESDRESGFPQKLMSALP